MATTSRDFVRRHDKRPMHVKAIYAIKCFPEFYRTHGDHVHNALVGIFLSCLLAIWIIPAIATGITYQILLLLAAFFMTALVGVTYYIFRVFVNNEILIGYVKLRCEQYELALKELEVFRDCTDEGKAVYFEMYNEKLCMERYLREARERQSKVRRIRCE